MTSVFNVWLNTTKLEPYAATSIGNPGIEMGPARVLPLRLERKTVAVAAL
jgi:hypothetical protein